MRTVSFTEFRRHASQYFDEVEQGESLRILRHGTPVAEVVPPRNDRDDLAWKKPGLQVSLEGESLSEAVLQERSESPR